MHDPSRPAPLRAGSLFSGYGGLDLAVEHVLGAETIWFSEINEHVADVFTHHWPDVPNLGDITTADWSDVPPIDVLCGGFPCQDVSTVGKQAGLTPGTRSGLWSHMAQAIDVLQPQLVVIENVQGLLSSPAVRVPLKGVDDANPDHATTSLRHLEPDPWNLGDSATRPLRAAGAVLGDLADLRYDAQWVGLPASLVGAPHRRLRVFIVAWRAVQDSTGDGLESRRRNARQGTGETRNDRTVSSGHRPGTQRTAWLGRQEQRLGDHMVPDREHLHRWGRHAHAVAQWEHITGRTAPTPTFVSDDGGPRPSPRFVEWLMGLLPGWVTDPRHGLTENQQLTALGNGVLPLQAISALRTVLHDGCSQW